MDRFRQTYGESPLHLLAVMASLALAGYAFFEIVQAPGLLSFAIFFAGAVVAHDLIAFPVYATLWWVAGRAIPGPRDDGASVESPSAVNHIRIPLLLSALAFIVWFPLILGLSSSEFEITTGLAYPDYLARWLGLSAVLFAGSGLVYALRLRLMLRYGD